MTKWFLSNIINHGESDVQWPISIKWSFCGIVVKGTSSISAWPLYQNMQSVYEHHIYIYIIHIYVTYIWYVNHVSYIINPTRTLSGQKERVMRSLVLWLWCCCSQQTTTRQFEHFLEIVYDREGRFNSLVSFFLRVAWKWPQYLISLMKVTFTNHLMLIFHMLHIVCKNYSPMQITCPWPPVGRFSHGLITLRQKETWT